MKISRTKIVGVLIFLVSILKLIIDLMDGNGVRLQEHFEAITGALGGMGLVFLKAVVGRR